MYPERPRKFYRFRPLENLIGKYKELESQTIFFPHPDQLNDAMEGHSDIYWKGDRVLWVNLFRHYLRCLCMCLLTAPHDEDRAQYLTKNNVFVRTFTHDLPSDHARQLVDDVASKFFACAGIIQVIGVLSNEEEERSQDELLFYLELVHDLAVSVVMDVFIDCGLYPGAKRNFESAEINLTKNLKDWFSTGIEDVLKVDGSARSVFAAARFVVESRNAFSSDFGGQGSAKQLLMYDFPMMFVSNIKRIMHPDWYAACFMGDYRNASVWGTYGDSYAGVCLVFDSEETDDGFCLDLYQPIGVAGRKDKDDSIVKRVIFDYRKLKFHKIDYGGSHPRLDFFKNIGRASIPVLIDDWYTLATGDKSAVAKVEDTEAWRAEYRNSFAKTATKKLSDWQHEDEYRLLLDGMLQDYSNKEDRKLKYKFNSLSGIIFGMKTPSEAKRKIISIVGEKCRAEGRSEFDFYQSYFLGETGKIAIVKIHHIWTAGQL
ncbi:hypothetical protein OMP44_10930 [Pseudomonas sp. CBMAI 2609]|uniref:DUF2971 domain-containing protein n=1 Tax=Pseudomonas flavocrustae TaxID=2991719 RepID=A0ABT6IFZ2_9PSED|nr:hypothetical protein [Pseudomonas sp. CBMAI 2609]MDH4763411.1 hypothetical protein [Pseudomonas sp. CBMAI 2609]